MDRRHVLSRCCGPCSSERSCQLGSVPIQMAVVPSLSVAFCLGHPSPNPWVSWNLAWSTKLYAIAGPGRLGSTFLHSLAQSRMSRVPVELIIALANLE